MELKTEEPYIRPFVSKRREMLKPVLTRAFLQPANTAAMCTAPRAETRPPPPIPPLPIPPPPIPPLPIPPPPIPPPPIPPFLLAQNLSSKRIAPTDNVRPKFHDEYTRHQWLKG